MQTDHQRPQDASTPHPEPSSPSFPPLHRHHQPTQPAEPYRAASPSGSTLRRRQLPQGGDIIRLDIRTPFENGASGTKEGVPVHRATTVRELKDGIADGQYGEGSLWIREGMRIVWQGRIVRDEEVIGDVVANVSMIAGVETRADKQSRSTDVMYTLHLVARRLGGTPAVPHMSSGYFPPALPVPSETIPLPAATSLSSTPPQQSPNPETQALLDSIHYLLFTARHHLFLLLGREPLEWSEMVPPPVVDAGIAREAVMSVVRTIVDARSPDEREVWTGWERAFEGGEDAGVRRLWETLSRESNEEDIQTLWRGRVGRSWSDSDRGQIVDVEIDHTVYQLHLPRLSSLTAIQVLHLLLYLQITSLLPLLYPFLPTPTPQPAADRPTPTPTTPLPVRPSFRSSLSTIASSLPRIPLPVLSHMFFMAFKLLAMLWMMTQGMPWSDSRLWIIAGAATGWWVVDGWQRYLRERPRPTVVPMAEGALAAPAVPGQAQPRDAPGQTVPTPASTRLAPHLAIPLVHLSTDTAQLRLITDTLNPARQLELARTPSPPARLPSKIVTQFLLPIALWFITLIPGFEAMRTRTIRRRERAMRVLVGELNTAPPAAPPAEGAAVEGEEVPTAAPGLVLPHGLNEVARKYYLRTMERGEGIDWEEEREAQRAMGIGREEEEGGGGLLDMF